MKVTKQKKIGVRPVTHKLYRETARNTRRSMAEVAQIAIERYAESIRESTPSRHAAGTAH